MADVDQALADVVRTAVEDALAPYLRRLTDPECLTYSVPQAAVVVGCSTFSIRKLIDGGHLPLVPHMEGRRLIPRRAVEDLIEARVAADNVVSIGKAT